MKAKLKEIPYKQWAMEQAEKQGVTVDAIQWRVKHGKYPGLKLRRVNGRVIYVRNDQK